VGCCPAIIAEVEGIYNKKISREMRGIREKKTRLQKYLLINKSFRFIKWVLSRGMVNYYPDEWIFENELDF